jgi:hypothetical protein
MTPDTPTLPSTEWHGGFDTVGHESPGVIGELQPDTPLIKATAKMIDNIIKPFPIVSSAVSRI